MPFIVPFIPAIIGATGAIAGGAMAGKSGGSTKNLESTFLDFAKKEEDKKMGLVDKNEGFLNFFSGDPMKSPLYSAYKTSDTESTAHAYDSAVTNMKATAQQRGFGYTSPVEQAGEGEIRGEEAADIGRIPGRALLQTIDPAMKAAGIRAGEASSFNPSSWGGDIANLEGAKQARSASLFSSLAGLAGNLGGQALDKWGNKSSSNSSTVDDWGVDTSTLG